MKANPHRIKPSICPLTNFLVASAGIETPEILANQHFQAASSSLFISHRR
jgi:hypothetical protein